MVQITAGFLWVVAHVSEVIFLIFFFSVEIFKRCCCLKLTFSVNIFRDLPCGGVRCCLSPLCFS